MRTESGNKIELGYARRQTADSPLSHWTISEQDLVMRARDDFNLAQTGYRAGVLVIPLTNVSGFFSGVVELREGDRLVGSYKARSKGETPRKNLYVSREGRNKLPAAAVDVILYAHHVLEEGGGAEGYADYEIVSVNARTTVEPQPIAPMTLLHNHFESDGGTATNMSAEELVEALRTSLNYWKNKAMLEPKNRAN